MESPLEGLSTKLSKPGPPVRPLKEKELGTVGESSTSNPGTDVSGAGLEAPNVSAQGAYDVDMGDEVAQRRVSDAEPVGSDEVREPRRRNSPSDQRPGKLRTMCRQGMQVSDRGAQLVSKGEVELRDNKVKAARSLKMGRRSRSCRGITVSLEPRIESVKRSWNSVETVRSW